MFTHNLERCPGVLLGGAEGGRSEAEAPAEAVQDRLRRRAAVERTATPAAHQQRRLTAKRSRQLWFRPSASFPKERSHLLRAVQAFRFVEQHAFCFH